MLPAPPAEVWESLPSLLGDDVELAAEPAVGSMPTVPRANGWEWSRSSTRPHRLAFWWVPADGDDAPSFVEVELDGSAVGTLLRVRETRFDAATVVGGMLRGPLARARA